VPCVNPGSADPVTGHDLFVQVHPQAGLFGDRDLAVDHRELLPGELLPQGPLLDAVLEVVRVRLDGSMMGFKLGFKKLVRQTSLSSR
jgi:hypothetical protein